MFLSACLLPVTVFAKHFLSLDSVEIEIEKAVEARSLFVKEMAALT